MMENAAPLLKNHYMELCSKKELKVGIELEFPILNFNGLKPDEKIIHQLIVFIIEKLNFKVVKTDLNGRPIRFKSDTLEDHLSFEACFYILEFSLEHNKSIFLIKKRFEFYYDAIQNYLSQFGCLLACFGSNPYRWGREIAYLHTEFHRCAKRFIKKNRADNLYNQRNNPCIMAALQLHVDIQYEDISDVLNVINGLSWFKAIYFSNSIFWNDAPDFSDNCCIRDYFWSANGMCSLKNSFPTYPRKFTSFEDYCQYVASNSPIFYVIRENKYYYIGKHSLNEFYSKNKIFGQSLEDKISGTVSIRPEKDDLKNFRQYNFAQVTNRGTIEIRSECQQPLSDIFSAVAFNVGLICAHKELSVLLEENPILKKYSPLDLRLMAVSLRNRSFLINCLRDYLLPIYDVVKNGLLKRNLVQECS